ncbi:MAG: MFS transporter [Bacteroidota bacterium]
MYRRLLQGTGFSFFIEDSLGNSLKYFTVGSMFIYIIFFAVSMGPLGWLILSEIFPLKVRGVGMSMGSLSCWLLIQKTKHPKWNLIKNTIFDII